MRETIAAVIMTKDCEELVEGTLESVASWVNEIVVVDGYSSDRTVDICRRYTDKIIRNRWDGYDFSTERNLGTRHATSDWCLHIDPDERATGAFREEVQKILNGGAPHAAFEFRKRNYFLGHAMRHGGWYHYSLHLFRRGKGVYEGVIHERLKVDGTIGKIEAAIEHYPFHSISQFIRRHNGYSTREALALRDKDGRLSHGKILHELGRMPLKRFLKFYVKKKGFLDGFYGIVFSILFAWVHFVNWAKYWELNERETYDACHARLRRAGSGVVKSPARMDPEEARPSADEGSHNVIASEAKQSHRKEKSSLGDCFAPPLWRGSQPSGLLRPPQAGSQ